METMNYDHPKWEEFLERLDGPEGCNFQQSDPKNTRSLTWKCQGGEKQGSATIILKDMDCDIKASFEFFNEHGGYCDCEILFNVTK
ncbi:hypothetical protein LCGC14_1321900 [marine sediment metagenome]|uniref:DUF2695 domain-containing protein n=1 Tax=marine sediment metagenome TaxID=412755 RepID=A0A0F9MZZ9_9ZZZZ